MKIKQPIQSSIRKAEIQSVSDRFSRILNRWLTDEELTKINEQNIKEPQYCATHEYCDPNEAICIAVDELLNTSDWSLDDPFILELITKAWELSSQNQFVPTNNLTERKSQ